MPFRAVAVRPAFISIMETNAMKWVTIAKYCADSGETRMAVDARRKRGIWLAGVHWSHPKVAVE